MDVQTTTAIATAANAANPLRVALPLPPVLPVLPVLLPEGLDPDDVPLGLPLEDAPESEGVAEAGG